MAMTATTSEQQTAREGEASSIEFENGVLVQQCNSSWLVRVRTGDQQAGGVAIICQRGSEKPYQFPSLQAAFTCLNHLHGRH